MIGRYLSHKPKRVHVNPHKHAAEPLLVSCGSKNAMQDSWTYYSRLRHLTWSQELPRWNKQERSADDDTTARVKTLNSRSLMSQYTDYWHWQHIWWFSELWPTIIESLDVNKMDSEVLLLQCYHFQRDLIYCIYYFVLMYCTNSKILHIESML